MAGSSKDHDRDSFWKVPEKDGTDRHKELYEVLELGLNVLLLDKSIWYNESLDDIQLIIAGLHLALLGPLVIFACGPSCYPATPLHCLLLPMLAGLLMLLGRSQLSLHEVRLWPFLVPDGLLPC